MPLTVYRNKRILNGEIIWSILYHRSKLKDFFVFFLQKSGSKPLRKEEINMFVSIYEDVAVEDNETNVAFCCQDGCIGD